MPGFTYTYTLTNGTAADADQVMQNFNDAKNGVQDGTKDVTVSALTANGAATFNGAVTLGNATNDDITFTGSLASSIPIKTTFSYDLGSATIGLRDIYFGSADSAARTTKIRGATVASSYTLTLPTAVGTIGEVLADTTGAGVTEFLAPNASQMGVAYLGLANATTTNANDSIKITSSSGSALSSSRAAYVCMPGTTAGQLTNFAVTADVTIKLTGATWGMGGNGDLTDGILRVYAINDAGTLKWGVSLKGGYRSITTTLSSATAADINLATEMLVTSTLTGTSACMEVGWFLADFDDTGGASEDLWTVQTAAGEIMVGVPAPVNYDWKSVTPTGSKTTNATYTGWEKRVGDTLECAYMVGFSGATDAGVVTFTLTGGKKIDTGKLPSPVDTNFRMVGYGSVLDNGVAVYSIRATAGSGNFPTTIQCFLQDDAAAGVRVDGAVSAASPITFGNQDSVYVRFSVPILGWSGNDAD